MLKAILILVALVIAAILAYAAFKPDSFSLQRTTVIAAPPEKIFALINDLHAFNTWNPFAVGDPSLKLDYQGAAAGKGAGYSWRGDKAGIGRMEISESTPSSKVTMQLHFTKPMESNNIVDFTLEPQANATQVTWAMRGPMNYMSKLMTTFISMDKMVGSQFEAGLSTLKSLVETAK